eukprot:scaffold173726_cov48-Attheya_sp.AAC.2
MKCTATECHFAIDCASAEDETQVLRPDFVAFESSFEFQATCFVRESDSNGYLLRSIVDDITRRKRREYEW